MDERAYAIELAGNRLNRFFEEIKRCREQAAADPIHDVRVSIRRLKQGLNTFSELFPKKATKKIKRQLDEVMHAAGALRDTDIAMELLAELKIPRTAALQKRLLARRGPLATEFGNVVERVSAEDLAGKWAADLKLHAETAKGGDEDASEIAIKTLKKTVGRFLKVGDKLAEHHNSSHELHRFRVRAKRTRYTLELFESMYGPAMSELMEEVKEVQRILGAMQDAVAAAELVKDLGAGDRVMEALGQRENKKIAQFRKHWEAGLGHPGAKERWLRYVARPAVQRMSNASVSQSSEIASATA